MKFECKRTSLVKRMKIKKPCFTIDGTFRDTQNDMQLFDFLKKIKNYIHSKDLKISGSYDSLNLNFEIWSDFRETIITEKIRKEIALWFKEIDSIDSLYIGTLLDESEVFDIL